MTEFGGIRQLVEMTQAEMIEEVLGGRVEQGAARHFGAARDLHQTPVEERLHDAVDGDAAHGLHVGAGDRLSVGDDRKGLEGRRAESGGLRLGIERAEPRSVARCAGEEPARGGLPHLIGAARGGDLGLKLDKRLADIGLLDLGEGGGHRFRLRGGGALEVGDEFLRGDGFLGCEEDRLDHMGEGGHFACRNGAMESLLGDGLGHVGSPGIGGTLGVFHLVAFCLVFSLLLTFDAGFLAACVHDFHRGLDGLF